MTYQLVVVGAGGFGRETLDVVAAVNQHGGGLAYDLLGVLDDSPSALNRQRLAAREVEWLGGIDEWIARGIESQYLLGIGNPLVRASVDERLTAAGYEAAIVVHPRATIGSRASLGPGTIVCAGVEISTNVSLGRHVHVNPNATVGHDTVVSDYVSINPGAIVSGDVTIAAQTLVGAGAVILQGLSIGPRVIVGASACVTRNVSKNMTVRGVPAR